MIGREARSESVILPAATTGLSRSADPGLPRPTQAPPTQGAQPRCSAARRTMNSIAISDPTPPATKAAQLDALRIAKNSAGAPRTPASATQILSRSELADYLGVCQRTVSKLERRGNLPRIKLGKRTVYRLDSILAALSRLEQGRAV